MRGSDQQRAQDDQVERALQQLEARRCIRRHCVDILRYFAVERLRQR
jgi:hypothetical protein